MIRLSRAGREDAITEAIQRLEDTTRYMMFTKGEICKKMGIRSSSKIRDILMGMVAVGQLVLIDVNMPGYTSKIKCYGIAYKPERLIPAPHIITINGKNYWSDDLKG